MARDLICISFASGAGGEEVGRRVAEHLGFLYVDDDIVLGAAARGGIDPSRVADEERRKSKFAGLLDYLSETDASAPAPTPDNADVPSEAVREFIRETITEAAERGGVVIAAHAASYVVSADRRPLRVLITAPADTRAGRIGSDERLEAAEAARNVRRSDANRADYLKRFCGVSEELPTHYDLVINTAELGVEGAAALVVLASKGEPALTDK
jgi:cytidylate kinase